MIISASRRTDIPAFHSEWMMNRLRAGYVLVRNPVSRAVVHRIDLSRENVDCIVFITKDPGPMAGHMKEVGRMGHTALFQVTMTPYHKDIEPYVRFKADISDSCEAISQTIGRDRMSWRYDPVILNRGISMDYHREFERVLGVRGINEYIRYGGTMCMSGTRYNRSPFGAKESADAYVDSAIACNIQHSLREYRHGDHFDHLRDLYDRNELTSVINRVVEDMNHRFALDVLTRDFESHDLGISASNLLRDREHPTDALNAVDRAAVTERLRRMLDVLDSDERACELTDAHVGEIKEYLGLLDLVKSVDVVRLPFTDQKLERTLITQPGLRYSQAEALIRSLMDDSSFADLSLEERRRITERILDEVKGRMMEDIVLLETMSAHPEKEVFVARFAVGEFDMVVFDPESGTCEAYEVKHSAEMDKAQRRHLEDAEKISLTEHRYGPVRGKYVIYRGEDAAVDGIRYLNVERYLTGIAGRPPGGR